MGENGMCKQSEQMSCFNFLKKKINIVHDAIAHFTAIKEHFLVLAAH